MNISDNLKIKSRNLKVFNREFYLVLGGLIFLGGVGIIISRFPLEITIATIVSVSCGIIGYFYIIKNSENKEDASFLVKVFFGGFLLRVIAVFVIYFVSIDLGGEGILGVGDEGAFYNIGWETAQNWRSGSLQVSPVLITKGYANWGYYLFNAVIYFIVGHNLLVVSLINSFLGTMMIVLIFKIATISYPRRVGKIAAVMVGFNPTLIFWSVLNLKDILFAFLLLATLIYVLALSKRWDTKIFIKFGILGVVLFTIRDSYALVWILLSSVFMLRKSTFRFLSWGVLFVGFIFLVSLPLPFTPFSRILGVLRGGDSLNFWAQTQRDIQNFHGSGGTTSIFYNVLVGSPAEFLKLLPMTIIRFFLTPLPWKATGFFKFIIPGTIMWYLLMPFTFYGIYYSIINKVKGSFLSIGFILAVLLVLSTVFLGGSPRHQVPIIPFYMMFAAVGLFKMRQLILLCVYVPITVSVLLILSMWMSQNSVF